MNPHIFASLLTLAACFVILCRVDKMIKGQTKPTVFAQHAILAMGLFCSVILNFTPYENWSQASMAAGLLVFFCFSIRRWKAGAPEGTSKPEVLHYAGWAHVRGGKGSP
jgi:hypothetical protein